MVWCSYCAKNIGRPDYVDGKICCSMCGRVLDEDNFSNEPTFVKNAAGQSQLSGNFVKTIQSEYSASRERILTEAYNGIESMIYALGIDGGDSISRPALAFYTIAVERNFTRGRRKEQVEAACLYIACSYVLGAVFLQLCKLLSLEEHPIVQKPVDPSLFIHRFTDRLFGGRKPSVSRTALHIVASMKRDWMQTGRKPSGLCGAALYISALSHGLKCSKLDVIKVVHVCEATLTKRLIEFENTESGSLTIEEFNVKAEEFEKEEGLNKQLAAASQVSGKTELLCEHKGSGRRPFAHGLCESCYSEFMQLSGGLDGGSEPPAFQRAERERKLVQQAVLENLNNSNPAAVSCEEGDNSNYRNSSSGHENLQFTESESLGAASVHPAIQDSVQNKLLESDTMTPDSCDESEGFSDIDDAEVDCYLHNEEEKHYKKIIWEEMNKEYLEEQAAKEAAAAAARKAYEATFGNCSEDMQAAQKLAAAAAAAVSKSRKEKQQKRAAELRNSVPAQTAAEATRQMLTRKRLSSKINYDVLEKLFEESAIPDNSKRSKPATSADDKFPHENQGSPGLDDDCEEEAAGGGKYDQSQHYDNVEENYNYDDSFDFSDY